MIRRLKKCLLKKNNGGFTLVEVIVSTALLSVLMIGIFAFVAPAMSMMQTAETDAHASNVASSLEYYITRSLRSTPFVKVFTNADLTEDAAVYGGAVAADSDLQAMISWAGKTENKNIYEVRCLELRVVEDPRTYESKYMLYQDTVDSTTGVITSSTAVFDFAFYTDIFPYLTIVQATNEYSDGTIAAGASGVESRPGIEITVNIYDDESMDVSSLIFSGYSLTELYMIASKGTSDPYCIYDTTQVRTDDVAAAGGYTDTFIYYMARKVKPSTTV